MFNFFNKFKKSNQQSQSKKAMTKSEILNYILDGGLSGITELKTERRNNTIYLPELQLTIEPLVEKASENTVVIHYKMYSELWQSELFECSTGIAADVHTALGMSLGTFAFSFLRGLKNIADSNVKCTVSSVFSGKEHRWKVYSGDITGTGEKNSPKVSDYWSIIGDDVIKRLGNQNIACVKVYLGKIGSIISGECRINDIPVPELSDKISAAAENWSGKGYVSEKQFFFIVQDRDTKVDYAYEGHEGEAGIQKAVDTYLKLFNVVDSQEKYDRIIEDTFEVVKDKTLAAECHYLIKEIFTEKAFEERLLLGDEISFVRPDGSETVTYKSQLSDYMAIRKAIFNALSSNLLGDRTTAVFSHLITMSTLRRAVEQYEQSGKAKGILKVSGMIFDVDDDFEIR